MYGQSLTTYTRTATMAQEITQSAQHCSNCCKHHAVMPVQESCRAAAAEAAADLLTTQCIIITRSH